MIEAGEKPVVQESSVNFIREGAKIGLINGLFALLLMYVPYSLGLEPFASTQFYSQFFPYMMIVLIVYGFQLRRRNDSFLAFKEGLQFAFMSYVISTLMIGIGTYILFNIVDPDLTVKVIDFSIEKSRNMMQRFGAETKEIEQELQKLEAQKKEGTGLKNIVLGMGMDLVWCFIKSLLITLVIRKEKPVR